MDIAPIIRENLTMKQELAKVKDELAKLKNDYTHLDKKYQELLILPKDSFNLDQFKANYLTTAFDEDTMPRVGGIYAYYNAKSKLLYIGQSVNMGNRLKQHFRNGKIKNQSSLLSVLRDISQNGRIRNNLGNRFSVNGNGAGCRLP